MRILCLLVFLSIASLFAQTERQRDVLTLHNGWVLRGEISLSLESIGITLADDSYFVFPREEVASISREPWPEASDPEPFVYPIQRGYYGAFSFGLLTGQSSYSYVSAALDLQWSNGYRLRPWLNVGGGLSVSFYESGFLMPLFAEVRGDLLQRRFTPHYFARAGYGLPLYQSDDYVEIDDIEPQTNESTGARGGLMGELGFGMKIYTRGGIGWLFSLSYRQQRMVDRYLNWEGFVNERRNYLNRLGFRVELMF